jgi:hypothetical protein
MALSKQQAKQLEMFLKKHVQNFAEGGPAEPVMTPINQNQSSVFDKTVDLLNHAKQQDQAAPMPQPVAEQPQLETETEALNRIRGNLKNAAQSVGNVLFGQPETPERKGQRLAQIGLRPDEPVGLPEQPNQGRPELNSAEQGLMGNQQALDTANGPMPASVNDMGMTDYQNQLLGGIQKQQAGIQAEAAAQGKLGEAQAAQLEQNVNQQKDFRTLFETEKGKLDQERQALLNDYNEGHIDPRRLVKNMSTGQKILNGIGLILGGMGAGLTGQENLAAKMFQRQIDLDVEAQAAEMGKKKSLLEANFRQYGNMKDAIDMTRAMLNDTTSNLLKMEAAKYQGSIAGARAMQQAGQLDREAAGLAQQVAVRRALIQAQGGQGQGGGSPEATLNMLRVLDPQRAKEMQERYVPGVGFASIAVPDKAREEMTMRKELGAAVGQLMAYARLHSGTVMDRATVNKGETMAKLVQDLYRRANNQGVFKESEAEFVNGIIAQDPTAFFGGIRTQPKYQALLNDNSRALTGLFKTYGLNLPKVNFTPAEKK